MSIRFSLDELADNFEMLGDWDTRYAYLVDLGKRLPALPEADRTDATKVHACMSNVWVVGDLLEGRIDYRAECDTAIIRGVIAVLVGLYSGRTPAEAHALDADVLFERLGLFDHLSPTRHVGVYAIVERMRAVARAHDATLSPEP